MGPISAMCSGLLLEIMKWILTRQSRRASAWKLERKGTRGMRWGFPRKISVGPDIREVEGWMVGKSEWTPAWGCYPMLRAEPSRAEPSRDERTKVETPEWRLKALLPCFRLSPYFLFPKSTLFYYTISPSTISLSSFDGMTVFRQRGTKNTGHA